MTKIVRWGIIGIGRIAEKFAQDLNLLENVELVAVASKTLERAQEFAVKYHALHAFGNYQDIFSQDLDVIYVASPHVFHKDMAILCLQNNVGVLCEKPFAMNEEEVLEIVNMAKEKSLFLMEALWTRFFPSIEKTLEIIASGRIGKIKTLQADFGFPAEYLPEGRLFNRNLGGGALLDIGIYPAFLALLVLGYPSKITANSIFSDTSVDVTTSFIYQYDNEATAVLNCTIAGPTPTEAIITGEYGYIKLSSRFIDCREITIVDKDRNSETITFDNKGLGYHYEIEEVNNCIRLGLTESPKLPLKFSLKLIHLLDKTREKADIVY